MEYFTVHHLIIYKTEEKKNIYDWKDEQLFVPLSLAPGNIESVVLLRTCKHIKLRMRQILKMITSITNYYVFWRFI